MRVTSTKKYVRMPARKVRLVAAAIRGMDDPQAIITALKFSRKKAAEPLVKTLQTALADATQTFKLSKEKLKLYKIEVNEGPTLKRWRPISRGRAHPIKKRTSHIRVIVEGE